MCFGAKGALSKGGRNSSVLLCGDLDSTLCDPGWRKAFVPWQPRVGLVSSAVQVKPNFWFEHAMFVPEITVGLPLLYSSLLQERGAGAVLVLTDVLPRYQICVLILRPLLQQNQMSTAGSHGQTNFPTIPT